MPIFGIYEAVYKPVILRESGKGEKKT